MTPWWAHLSCAPISTVKCHDCPSVAFPLDVVCWCACLHYRVSDKVYPECCPSTSQLEVPHKPVWVRPHDFTLAKHAQPSFKISTAVSISLSQFSSLVVSHPSNVRMSWSKVVRLVCHCVAHSVSVYCYIAVCMGLFIVLQSDCSCNIMLDPQHAYLDL